jgi:hypothetical protein
VNITHVFLPKLGPALLALFFTRKNLNYRLNNSSHHTVNQPMRVDAAKQANQNHGRQTKREADVEDDAPESGAAPTAPPDLYDILGYRSSFLSGATTQEWLAVRLIEV